MSLPHLPIIRCGKVYESLDVFDVCDHRTKAAVVSVSEANPGLIRRDLQKLAGTGLKYLRSLSHENALGICRDAGDIFLGETLPYGLGGHQQSPDDYVEILSATSGMPFALCRENMIKIHYVLTNMPVILAGLTRNVDLRVVDGQFVREADVPLSFIPATASFGVVLPNNSPGVNSLWLPALGLKIPVAIKPGRDEPHTSWRIIQALIQAGYPAEALCYYPTNHKGVESILDGCGRSVIFGDAKTVQRYADKSRVSVHGPGHSKIVIGIDKIGNWRDYLPLMIQSISANSGRSCINASTIIVPNGAEEIADALAKELAKITPRALNHDDARLSAFARPAVAEHLDTEIDEALCGPDAQDISQKYRKGSRRIELDGSVFLQPTVIYCQNLDHPLANREYMFPFVSVVEATYDEIFKRLGPTLALTAVTGDQSLIDELLRCSQVDRLNIGPIPTNVVDWNQPHQGNLFEFLYKRRAVQYREF